MEFKGATCQSRRRGRQVDIGTEWNLKFDMSKPSEFWREVDIGTEWNLKTAVLVLKGSL